MINATTHTGAEHHRSETVAPVRRLSSRAFATLLAAELLLIIGVAAWALFTLVPTATPLAAPQDLTPVREAIVARLVGEVPDPLIEVAPGLSARSSNLRGFSLGEATYYYYVEGAANFDPLSRGSVAEHEIEVLLRDESGPAVVVIYRLL